MGIKCQRCQVDLKNVTFYYYDKETGVIFCDYCYFENLRKK